MDVRHDLVRDHIDLGVGISKGESFSEEFVAHPARRRDVDFQVVFQGILHMDLALDLH